MGGVWYMGTSDKGTVGSWEVGNTPVTTQKESSRPYSGHFLARPLLGFGPGMAGFSLARPLWILPP